jgi:outer membrane protein TolC
MRRVLAGLALLTALAALPALAQDRLTVADAQRRAQATHAEARLAALDLRDAAAQVAAARGAFLPRVDLAEGWQRGDLPVYAFGTLLSQGRFAEDNFDVSRLNHPDAVDDFRSVVTVEQTIFDAGLRPGLESARLARDAAAQGARATSQALASTTVEAYGRVLALEALDRAAAAAVSAAQEDATRAGHRRDAGRATDADVLTVEWHLAAMRQREIDTAAELTIARARLNDLVGAPLEAVFVLDPLELPSRRRWRAVRTSGSRASIGRSRRPPSPRPVPPFSRGSSCRPRASGTAHRLAPAKRAGSWARKRA